MSNHNNVQDFSSPQELLKLLLSLDDNYENILALANKLLSQVETEHVTMEDKKYHVYSQVILECYKKIYNFQSNRWSSEARLPFEPSPDETPIKFTRQNAKGEPCEYSIYNEDQLDKSRAKDIVAERKNKKIRTSAELEVKILEFLSIYDGQFGGANIAKIFSGDETMKEIIESQHLVNFDFFGIVSATKINSILKMLNKMKALQQITNKNGKYYTLTKLSDKKNQEEDDPIFTQIVKLINSGENLFITGHAGTGKSYILNKIKNKFPKMAITSTTGIAAVNVRGQTIHSWAGVGVCRKPVSQIVQDILGKRQISRQIKNCKLLAIDEISMLDMRVIEYLDEVFKEVRANQKPFGGIQVIFIGDFFQLPPVESDTTANFCFESQVWKDFTLKNVLLTQNYRQSENNFITALANMRTNRLTTEDVEFFNSKNSAKSVEDEDILHIFPTNYEAENYNMRKFNAVMNATKSFSAYDTVARGSEWVADNLNEREKMTLEIFDKNCRVGKDVALKIDARVMLLVNMDFEKGLINGSCGVVEDFHDDSVLISFDNGETELIPRHKFEHYYNDKVVATRLQYPLKLAYGITIHKSQGMTLDKLVVDCARIFEKGQAYVAMSRVKTIAGLYLKNFNKSKVMVNEKVANFYDNMISELH